MSDQTRHTTLQARGTRALLRRRPLSAPTRPHPPLGFPSPEPSKPSSNTPDDWLLALTLIIINFTIPGNVVQALRRHYTPGDPSLSYPSVHVPLSGEAAAAPHASQRLAAASVSRN